MYPFFIIRNVTHLTVFISHRLSTSSYWLFFINKQVFFEDLRDDSHRSHMQPSLVLSALALATLMKSSEIEHGQTGRDRALYLRDQAQSALEAACHAQAVDFTLAEAALVCRCLGRCF